MTKAKAKPKATAQPAGDGPTPERLARDAFDTIAAPRFSDEDWRNRGGTVRRLACRVTRMHRDGWIDDDGLRALLAYQSLIESAGYDRGRSSMDFSPKGDGAGLPHAVVIKRAKLAEIDRALLHDLDRKAVDLLHAVLGPYGLETVGAVAEKMNPDMGRDSRAKWARDVFAVAGARLADLAR